MLCLRSMSNYRHIFIPAGHFCCLMSPLQTLPYVMHMCEKKIFHKHYSFGWYKIISIIKYIYIYITLVIFIYFSRPKYKAFILEYRPIFAD